MDKEILYPNDKLSLSKYLQKFGANLLLNINENVDLIFIEKSEI